MTLMIITSVALVVLAGALVALGMYGGTWLAKRVASTAEKRYLCRDINDDLKGAAHVS